MSKLQDMSQNYKLLTKGMSFVRSRLETKLFNVINHWRNGERVRVKLVAIAKDEAAYIPDWIFHHLHFGFDAIDIYVNNTSDNTQEIANKFTVNKQVSFIEGDAFFQQNELAPQIAVYLSAFNRSRRQGYSHVVFLDTDEFWMAKDFLTNIHTVLKVINSDVVAFEWLNKLNDHQPFSPVVESEIVGRRAPQVKVAVNTKLNVTRMNPHNVFSSGTYLLANGCEFIQTCVPYSRINKEELSKPIKEFFILHRMCRSQLEYIAALARGRPIQNSKKKSLFKSNRRGYEHGEGSRHIKLNKEFIAQYYCLREQFMQKFGLKVEILVARKLVKNRCDLVLRTIREAPIDEFETLKKVLENLDLDELINARNIFCNRHGVSF